MVSSDDPKWCKQNFKKFKRTLFYTSNMRDKHGLNARNLDMAIAASCNHTIYDYGSFGFWGAYLAGGYTMVANNVTSHRDPGIANLKPAHFRYK